MLKNGCLSIGVFGQASDAKQMPATQYNEVAAVISRTQQLMSC
jgi:hypothetical protein|tara:strand:+ start:692 stop:820 length:129 start_codon:yes stop_codon:yes gene_type:complete